VGNDVFGVLPTGYGESLCYGCLPATFDYLPQEHSSIIFILSIYNLNLLLSKIRIAQSYELKLCQSW